MNWQDYQEIGAALKEVYPTANYMTISDDDLARLVAGLPGFDKAAPPPDGEDLSSVRFAWIAAAEGPDDTGPYDALA